MNRTIRNLVIAVPLATVGLTMVNTGAAIAGPDGPKVIVMPKDDPQPPIGPKDIADAPKPTDPKGPKDFTDAPKPKAPKPAPQPQAPQSAPAADTTVEVEETEGVDQVVSAKGSPDSIDRSDILFVAEPADTALEAAGTSDNGMDLTWLLIGGGLVTASGIAFAARKRSNI